MENITYDDLLDRPLPEVDRKSMEFTAHSSDIVAEIVQDGIAETDDPKIIFQTLKNNIRLIPFGAYLRRYIFRSMGGKGDYDSIPVKEYKQIIMTSFRENYTPKSFHDTTVKFSTLVEGWLERDSVSRETVFLLGFGLRMPVEDVSMFLKTALKDQDFNVTDPRELIIQFCLKNHRPAGTAIELIRKYCDNENTNRIIVRNGEPDGTMTIRSRASQFRSEDELEEELMRLLGSSRSYPYSRTGMRMFQELYQKSRLYAWQSQNATFEDKQRKSLASFSHSDFEQILYSGIRRTASGNLERASASVLNSSFTYMRLSRQRISKILAGQTQVNRYDLMTLLFYNMTRELDEDTSIATRFNTYVSSVNRLLTDCFMDKINISNPYETFLLMCMLTPDPIMTFEDVWSFSYEYDEF